MVNLPDAHGLCAPGFESVRRAFIENFTDRGERGAGLCVMVNGDVVVDLVGGWADADQRVGWSFDTLVNAFSVGKGVLATLAAQLVDDGHLEVDRTVESYWPGFGRHGKTNTTVRDLLSHQAGLPALRHRLSPNAMLDWDLMVSALADERPWWEPGTAVGYHTNTFGFLVGEVLRRVSGASPGELLAARLAGPLGADLYWGLPPELDDRTATFFWPMDPPPEREPDGLDEAALMEFNGYFNPSGLSGAGVVNTRAWRAAQMPSTNLHASARGVARLYAALANGGTLDGVRVISPSALAAATCEASYAMDRVLGRPSRFGLGFQLTMPERPLGPNDGAFGHFGAGGSLGCADPTTGCAIGYVISEMGPRWQNPRNRAILDAVFGAISG